VWPLITRFWLTLFWGWESFWRRELFLCILSRKELLSLVPYVIFSDDLSRDIIVSRENLSYMKKRGMEGLLTSAVESFQKGVAIRCSGNLHCCWASEWVHLEFRTGPRHSLTYHDGRTKQKSCTTDVERTENVAPQRSLSFLRPIAPASPPFPPNPPCRSFHRSNTASNLKQFIVSHVSSPAIYFLEQRWPQHS